ncbi:MAG: hypothetical protein H8E66_33650 [Planctomycetes bacterium]|nr:hypothetical protein [Planctomycetota bacterium]
MIHRRIACYVVLLVAAETGIAAAQQFVSVGNRLEAHTQARALANELVASVFDIQLRHLEENGLSEQSIYAEIRASRQKIDQLASQDMEQLTRLLTDLQTAQAAARSESLSKARVAARQVAVAMMAERHRLRGRLRSSRTIILARQMITLEMQAIAATDRLMSQPNSERRRPAQDVVQSHLDLDVLYDQLVLALQQGQEVIGQERIVATTVFDHLTNEQTKEHIARVAELLRSGDYEDARRDEQAIVGALQEALRLLQQGDKLEEEARRKAIEAIERTVKEQQEVRQLTESTELSESKQREDLAAKQRRIAEQLGQLREPLSQLARVDKQMLAATDAAEEAVQLLDEGEKRPAMKRQEAVLSLLDEISRHLNIESLDPDALADRAAQLEELSSSLDELVEKQAEVGELVADDPATAAELEAAIAESLEEADDASQLSNEVEMQLDEAQDAVAKALESLDDGSPSAEQSRLQAVDNAENSLMEAAAEVQSQLADAQQAMEAGNPSESNTPSDSTSKNEASSGTTRDSGSNTLSEQAIDVEARKFENEAWFLSLPAALQNRVRAATRRPPPRGYEMRLQRYFQTSD